MRIFSYFNCMYIFFSVCYNQGFNTNFTNLNFSSTFDLLRNLTKNISQSQSFIQSNQIQLDELKNKTRNYHYYFNLTCNETGNNTQSFCKNQTQIKELFDLFWNSTGKDFGGGRRKRSQQKEKDQQDYDKHNKQKSEEEHQKRKKRQNDKKHNKKGYNENRRDFESDDENFEFEFEEEDALIFIFLILLVCIIICVMFWIKKFIFGRQNRSRYELNETIPDILIPSQKQYPEQQKAQDILESQFVQPQQLIQQQQAQVMIKPQQQQNQQNLLIAQYVPKSSEIEMIQQGQMSNATRMDINENQNYNLYPQVSNIQQAPEIYFLRK